MKINNKGLSLVELLVVVAILGIVLGAIAVTYTGSLRVFTNVKSLSDPIETKTHSIELIARYFDRWGVGVVAENNKPGIGTPVHEKYIEVKKGSTCDEVIFYGNLYGLGFVREVDDKKDEAKIISCRLSTSTTNQNCYTVWRANSPLNNIVSGKLEKYELRNLSSNNADCSNLSSNTTNATMSKNIRKADGNIAIVADPGDVIQRFAHKIRLYCSNNSQDDNRQWLYADLTDFYGACNENEAATPITPVDEFIATPLPNGCNGANGECKAIQVKVKFRSQSRDYGGQYKTYEATRVFGR